MPIPEYESLNNKETKKENRFKRLLVIRCCREDRAMLACTDYINDCLGEAFTDTYTSNYDDILVNEINPINPNMLPFVIGFRSNRLVRNHCKEEKDRTQADFHGLRLRSLSKTFDYRVNRARRLGCYQQQPLIHQIHERN